MLIPCEKCGTTYVLDDKLIPAQGAPVQCTRCGHVFIAKATGAKAQSAAPAKTAMFGAPGSEATGGATPTNQTMMFGVPGGAAAAGAPAAPNKTMMFGASGAEPPPNAPLAALNAQPVNKTMKAIDDQLDATMLESVKQWRLR